jgi:hypothetical protein
VRLAELEAMAYPSAQAQLDALVNGATLGVAGRRFAQARVHRYSRPTDGVSARVGSRANSRVNASITRDPGRDRHT